MKSELTDAQWLHEHAEITFEEMVELSGLSPELLRELVEHGALTPINEPTPTHVQSVQWRFTANCVVAVRAVNRLHEDFDLDANALSVALTLIERIHDLEARLQELQTQFPKPRRN